MTDWTNSIQTGDAREQLRNLPESSVHCVMTSPPYFGLRNYNHEDQIGLEETLEEYIDRLVRVGDCLRRVLRDDGSWWLNLGDSYAGDKQKMLVPHRVAIALQKSGWVVRNDVTWVKPNPMPQSVKDRLNTTTEQIFHLTPAPDYWYDLDAIREPYSEGTIETHQPGYGWSEENKNARDESAFNTEQDRAEALHPAGKNPGDVFEVSTKPFPDAHFAVYPPELCEKPIKATCPPKVCADCGSPYEREVKDADPIDEDGNCKSCGRKATRHGWEEPSNPKKRDELSRKNDVGKKRVCSYVEHKGWRQTCDCATDATESGICLDPFAGAGTTLLKAKELGRRFAGIELNPEYADMARARVGLAPNDPSNVRSDDAQEGLEAFADGGGSE